MTFFKNKLAVIVVLLSVTFLALIGYSLKRENKSLLENGVGVTLNSIQGVVYKINDKAYEYISFMLNFSEVKKENEELRLRNSALEEKALLFDSLKSENDRLRGILDFKTRNSYYDFLVCHIMGRPDNGELSGYIIDKGVKDGVVKGMVVVNAEGLIGQVTSTASNWSIVQTLADENIAVGAMVENTKDNNGVVKGYKDSNKNLLAKIYYLPLNSEIKEGDIITTSGDGFLYPKGIRIGKVLKVEEDRGKVMKNAVIEPYVDFNKLEEVSIIIPKDKLNIRYEGEIK
jgi:rod shape-determining protein MreC